MTRQYTKPAQRKPRAYQRKPRLSAEHAAFADALKNSQSRIYAIYTSHDRQNDVLSGVILATVAIEKLLKRQSDARRECDRKQGRRVPMMFNEQEFLRRAGATL